MPGPEFHLALDTTGGWIYRRAMNEMLIAGGLMLAGFALRTFASVWLGRIGNLTVLCGTYLAAMALFHSVGLAVAVTSLWLVIPAARVWWTAQHFELPLDKRFTSRRAPSREDFPQLAELTREFTGEGFVVVEDVGWQSEHWDQFSRLLVNEDQQVQGSIHYHRQGSGSLVYVSLISRTADGRQWTTWNYPYRLGLKVPPEMILNCEPDAHSLSDLLARHETFVARKTAAAKILPPEPERLVEMTQDELCRQIDHNLDAGLLQLSGAGNFTYSWRGTLYVLRQFLIDLLRYP